ncbi:MAG: hypothetical protein EBR02_10105 [Alphaproteobacteria bacterium]|nr:hypothetical protein [Alphaproteobacteria bacterium]
MGIVLLIIATVVGGGMVVFTASLDKQKDVETRGKMQVLQKALLDYRRAFNRIPCPANVQAAVSAAAYGAEYTAGDCSGTGSVTLGGTYFYLGMVPTKALRLPDDMAIDGWGRRIMYAVDNRMTGNTDNALPFETVAVNSDVTTPTARITVNDAMAAPITDKAVYVLLSYGENGDGAYPRKGGATPIDTGSTNVNEQENTDNDTVFVQGANVSSDTSDRKKIFDDIVVYATRAQLFSPTE